MKKEAITSLSFVELGERLLRAEHDSRALCFAHAISPIENPLRLRYARRLIASIKTELRKRVLQTEKNNPTKDEEKS